ncbi:hypothetical protein D9619_000332 [Psilocybe cf. subviscida]|uniref:Uncharacterized protein n=1 Tax=Psilocybe cf. subviscida TaxID=2480587 RepID=A0A8H5F3R5_9AGAR|nr:hypothetical protein D9619_000332 [Psilocybe cf. subviscida]
MGCPAWSCHPQTPSSYSSSQPPTPLILASPHPYPYPNHYGDREQLNANSKELVTQRQAEVLQAYERKFGQGSLGLSLSGNVDPSCFTDSAIAASYTANGAHDYGAWSQEIGADGLEIELGTMLHF